MRTIVQISDLHFGTEDEHIAEVLLGELNEMKPSLIVVSGDLTQRARKAQFIAARKYLDRLQQPYIVIPGNHDIPLFDVFRRFLAPLNRYKKYITDNMMPVFKDDEIAVMGINTARSFTWKNGRISHEQIAAIKTVLCDVPNSIFKVVVTHHPFIPPPGEDLVDLVDRAELALEVIDPCGIDLLMAGHLHHGYTGDIRTHYPAAKRPIIVAQAGTAISRRVRGEPNSYNVFTIDGKNFRISVRVYGENKFNETTAINYVKEENIWGIIK